MHDLSKFNRNNKAIYIVPFPRYSPLNIFKNLLHFIHQQCDYHDIFGLFATNTNSHLRPHLVLILLICSDNVNTLGGPYPSPQNHLWLAIRMQRSCLGFSRCFRSVKRTSVDQEMSDWCHNHNVKITLDPGTGAIQALSPDLPSSITMTVIHKSQRHSAAREQGLHKCRLALLQVLGVWLPMGHTLGPQTWGHMTPFVPLSA